MSKSDPPVEKRLNFMEVNILANYNSEVSRGLMHTEEWKSQMDELQHRFNSTGGWTVPPKKR